MSRHYLLARKRLLQRGQLRSNDRGGAQKQKSMEVTVQRYPVNPEAALSAMMNAARRPPDPDKVRRLALHRGARKR